LLIAVNASASVLKSPLEEELEPETLTGAAFATALNSTKIKARNFNRRIVLIIMYRF